MLTLQIGLFIMLLVSAAALAGAFILSRKSTRELEHHIDLVAGHLVTKSRIMSHPSIRVGMAAFDQKVRRAFCLGVPYRWGLRTGGLTLLSIAAGAGGIVAFLAFRISGHSVWIAGGLGTLALYFVPRMYLVREQRRAERLFLELFPNAIDMIIRILRAGLPITTAVRSIAVESPPPVSTVFLTIADQVDIGVPFDKALDAASEQIGAPDFRFFSVAVTLQHTTGGNLAATLEILSDIIRKRRAIRMKAGAATAEVRVTAYVLGSMPVMIIGALIFLSPGYVEPLIHDRRGNYILAAAGGLFVLAYLTMRMMMRRVTAFQ